MPVAVALWTMKPFWPAGIFNGCFTLLLLAISGEEFVQAHAWLKLDPILLHGIPPLMMGIP
jgi:hypothetical protein